MGAELSGLDWHTFDKMYSAVDQKGRRLEETIAEQRFMFSPPKGFDIIKQGSAKEYADHVNKTITDKINSATKEYSRVVDAFLEYFGTHVGQVLATAIYFTDAKHAPYSYRIELRENPPAASGTALHLAKYLHLQQRVLDGGIDALRAQTGQTRGVALDWSNDPPFFQPVCRDYVIAAYHPSNPELVGRSLSACTSHAGNITEQEFVGTVQLLKEMEQKLPIAFTWIQAVH